jgi:hypothetical protein
MSTTCRISATSSVRGSGSGWVADGSEGGKKKKKNFQPLALLFLLFFFFYYNPNAEIKTFFAEDLI